MDKKIVNILKSHGCGYMADDYKEMIEEIETYVKKREEAITVTRCCKSDSEQFMCECGESTIYQTKSSNMKWCNKCGKVHT